MVSDEFANDRESFHRIMNIKLQQSRILRQALQKYGENEKQMDIFFVETLILGILGKNNIKKYAEFIESIPHQSIIEIFELCLTEIEITLFLAIFAQTSIKKLLWHVILNVKFSFEESLLAKSMPAVLPSQLLLDKCIQTENVAAIVFILRYLFHYAKTENFKIFALKLVAKFDQLNFLKAVIIKEVKKQCKKDEAKNIIKLLKWHTEMP